MGTTETANGKCFRLGDHQPSECVPRCPGGWGHQHDQTSFLTFSTSDEFKTVPSCVNGKCTSPSSCSCYPGWTGPHCTQLCRWWPSSSTLAILMLVMNINLFQEVFFRRGTWGPNCGQRCTVSSPMLPMISKLPPPHPDTNTKNKNVNIITFFASLQDGVQVELNICGWSRKRYIISPDNAIFIIIYVKAHCNFPLTSEFA